MICAFLFRYTIQLSHGQFSWVIHKRYKHFVDLHEKLWTYRASLKLPFPSKKLVLSLLQNTIFAQDFIFKYFKSLL